MGNIGSLDIPECDDLKMKYDICSDEKNKFLKTDGAITDKELTDWTTKCQQEFQVLLKC